MRSITTICRRYHISPRVVREACLTGHIPSSLPQGATPDGGQNNKTRVYIDDTQPEFHQWLKAYKTLCLANQDRRATVPLLALGMYAAKQGIVLKSFPTASDTRWVIEQPLKEVLFVIEHEGQRDPYLARMAAKEAVVRVLVKGPRGTRWHPVREVTDHYVDLAFDQVLGIPLWENYLRFVHREQLLLAAYRQAFLETQDEWWAEREANGGHEEAGPGTDDETHHE